MKYRKLGDSDLQVPVISLGSWLTYSGGVEKRQAMACVHKALDLGINFFDTANVYGRGAAETVLGEALAGIPRHSYSLATKVYGLMSDTDKGLSRAQIAKQLDASLKRLGTDFVDLYQCHRYDEETPLAETMEALTLAVKQGKTRYVGFSEWPLDKIEAAAKMSDVVRFVSSSAAIFDALVSAPRRDFSTLCRTWNRANRVVTARPGRAHGQIRGRRAAPGGVAGQACVDGRHAAATMAASPLADSHRPSEAIGRTGRGREFGAICACLDFAQTRSNLRHRWSEPSRTDRGERRRRGTRDRAGAVRESRRDFGAFPLMRRHFFSRNPSTTPVSSECGAG